MLKSEYRNEALQAIDTLMPMITVQKSDFENFRLLCCLSKGERHITTHILGVLTDTVIVGRSLVSISEDIRLLSVYSEDMGVVALVIRQLPS